MSEGKSFQFAPGTRFHGYVVERLLGQGGIGDVYLVRHEVLDTYFALKVLHPDVALRDETYVKRFLREARIATRIRHPNLVAVHDCGREGDVYYLVMDYVAGGSLRDALAFEGRFTPERAADVVLQVASALKAVEAFRVVHRDIKPENIMLTPEGVAKLVDLGVAKADNMGDSLRTKTDSVFGTPAYASPEQTLSSANVDVRADIYSLGIVFYEMLTGKCPYGGLNPAQVLEKVLADESAPDIRDVDRSLPAGLAVLVRRMTMKERERRLSSFGAVLDELAKLGFGKRPEAQKVEFAEKPAAGMKTILEGLKGPAREETDPLSEPDEGVRDFLATRERRERRKRIVRAAFWVVLAVLAAGLVAVFAVP